MKNVLILGGTHFIGRNLVEHFLLEPDYKLTLFNRQKTQSELFPKVDKIKGDRETDDVKNLKNQTWDFVIDLSCYFPQALLNVLENLTVKEKYIFISTCSVYDNTVNKSIGRNESAATLPCSHEEGTNSEPASYGNRKAECERILRKSGLPFVILRPALVFGKYDTTDRFYYWLHQVKEKETLLLPENGERLFSVTYVKDLITTIHTCMKGEFNNMIINVITKPKTSIIEIVELAQLNLGRTNKALLASADFLDENNISQWVDMPLWIHGDFFTYSNEKLQVLGIAPTPMKRALAETIDYYKDLNWPTPKYGIVESKRIALIRSLKQKSIIRK